MAARSGRWLVAGATLVAALALAACSANDSATPASIDAGVSAPKDQSAGGDAAYADPQAKPPSGGTQAQARVEPQRRSLVYTGSITVRADDVAAAANRALDIATEVSGVIGGDRRTLNNDRSEAQLVLRVPADRFAATMDRLSKLGVEETRAIVTEDVTEAVIDLDARLATQQASVDRIRVLLARAQTIGEITSVEAELTRRMADLDSLKQRKEKLADLVSLSTITLNLHGPAVAPPPQANENSFLAGLRKGWSAFVDSVNVVILVAGYLAPWAAAVGAPIATIWFLRRRRRPTPPPAPPLTPLTPAP